MTPIEVAAKLRSEANKEHGIVKYSTAHNAAKTIEALIAWIKDEGERTNACTRNITGEVCTYCACGKSKGKP
jgi:hypothetical protein